MAKKRRIAVIVIVLVLGLIALALMSCCGIFWWGGGMLIGEYEKVQDEFLSDVCYEISDSTNYTEEDYEEIFSDNFKATTSYEESKEVLKKAMPKDGCDQLEIKNFIDMIKKGLAFEISTASTNGVTSTTAKITYPGKNGQVALYLIKVNNEWKIDDISS